MGDYIWKVICSKIHRAFNSHRFKDIRVLANLFRQGSAANDRYNPIPLISQGLPDLLVLFSLNRLVVMRPINIDASARNVVPLIIEIWLSRDVVGW